jgi:hypothetical protein
VVTLNMDHLVSGVGGTANSVLNPYQVHPCDTQFTFYIRPLLKQGDPALHHHTDLGYEYHQVGEE